MHRNILYYSVLPPGNIPRGGNFSHGREAGPMKNLLVAALLTAPVWAQPTLSIEAKPAEALIFVDRQLRGQGTAQLTDLKPGQHLVRISAGEDWETHLQQVKLDTQTVRINVQLKPGSAKWLRLGRQALNYGDWAEAVQSFKQAAPAKPILAAWWEGVSHYRAGQYASALAAFRRYAQFMPEVPELHWLLGQLHERLGHPGNAFTAYKTAALAQPELKDALDRLPTPTDKAIAQLRGKTQRADRLRLAQLLMLKGQLPEAMDLARGVLGEQYEKVDWLRWDPPLPPPPPIEVAPPEDEP